MIDSNSLLIAYLQTQTTLGALIGYVAPTDGQHPTPAIPARIYCPRVPDVGILPCISLFRRGGTSNPWVTPIMRPSFQIDCWANDSVTAEQIYGALYDCLQSVINQPVTINGHSYLIMSAIEETQGQTLQDIDIITRFRTLAFFQVLINTTGS